MHKAEREKIIYRTAIAVGAALLVILCLYDISAFHLIHVLPDEFGYWSAGAFFAGKDWSGVTSQLYYYSYGYGFWLALLVRLFGTANGLYRGAIVLNTLLLLGCYVLAVYVIRSMFPKLHRIGAVCIAFLVTCYASNLVNVRVAWPEILLTFYMWLVCALLFSAIKRATYPKMAGLALVSMLMYMTHQRALGVVVSLCIAVFLIVYKGHLHHQLFGCFLGTMAVLFVLQQILKKWLTDKVWLQGEADYGFLWKELLLLAAAAVGYIGIVYGVRFLQKRQIKIRVRYILIPIGVVALAALIVMITRMIASSDESAITAMDVNDYNGVFQNLKNILVAENGLLLLLRGFFGKLYYVGVSTGLLAIWGLVLAVRQALLLCRPESGASKQAAAKKASGSVVCLFMALSFLSSVAISSIFMLGGSRQDCIIYGRYSEFVLGPLLAVGMITLFYTGKKLRPLLWVAALSVAGVFLTYQAFEANTDLTFNIISNVGVSAFFQSNVSNLGKIVPLFLAAFGLFLLLYALSYVPVRKKRYLFGAGVTAAVCFALWFPNVNHMIRELHDAHENIYDTYEEFADCIKEYSDAEELYYLAQGQGQDIRRIQYLQFMLPNTKIHYLLESDAQTKKLLAENKEGWLIVPQSHENLFELYDSYYWVDSEVYGENPVLWDWRLFVPIDSEASERLLSQGDFFHNVKGGLQFGEKEYYSDNRDKSNQDLWVSNGEPGYLCYGPYITLPAGEYVFQADLTTVEILGYPLFLDVHADGVNYGMEEVNLLECLEPGTKTHVEIPFTLEETTDKLEFRVYTGIGNRLAVDCLKVLKR